MTKTINNDIHAKKIINLLYLHGEEMQMSELSEILKISTTNILDIVPVIKERLDYAGLELISHNHKLSIVTPADYHQLVKDFSTHIINSDLTPAQLQTITIAAYLGEVSISDISFVRGIQSNQTVRSLTTRGLLEKSKSSDKRDAYVISTTCLQYLGITKQTDLKDYHIIQEKLRARIKDALLC